MKSNASLLAMLAIATGMLLGAASGCELIAGVDRNKISETGGAGGEGGTTASTGGGGTTTSSSDTGGTTTSGPNCVDPLADCGTPSGECKVFSCVEGECVEGNVANGMDATTQTAMDCKKNICTDGEVVSLNDDTDPLDDNNDCTVDVCEMGDPKSNPADLGTPCTDGANKVCDDMSTCVECNVKADCMDAAKPDCLNNACVPATCSDGMTNAGETDQDCGGPCKGCDTNQNCDDAADCFHGICGGNGKCAAPTCDDDVQNGGDYLGSNGETDKDCGGPCGPTCGPMLGCEVNGDCVGNQCTGAGGTCVPNCFDGEETGNESDADCGGDCMAGCALNKDCEGSDDNCIATAYCEANDQCTAKKAPGIGCMGTNQCLAGVCDMTDGVCCDTMCSGTCESCKLAGSPGICTNIQSGLDPEDECAGTQVCNDVNQCRKENGDTCTLGNECLSDNCIDGRCCNTACGGACKACNIANFLGQCVDIGGGQDPANECAGALSCTGNGACQLPPGQPCLTASQCGSGFCVDGVCCGTACASICTSCNLAGAEGTCSPLVAGDDPDGECSGGNPSCNGAGACGKAVNGTPCVDNSGCTSNQCIDGFCCDGNCNGLCEACSAAKTGGTNGTCAPVTAGTDPDAECSTVPAPNCAAGNACGP